MQHKLKLRYLFKINFKGFVCWSNNCNGVYNYECGALCVESAKDCLDFVKGMASNVINVGFDVMLIIASMGRKVESYFSAAGTILDIASLVLNDICASPNIKQEVCIRSESEKRCIGETPFQCGPAFCTSTQMVCAKTIVTIVSQTLTVLSMVGGVMKNKKSEELSEKFLSDKQKLRDIIDFIKGAKEATAGISVLQTLTSIVMGPISSGCKLYIFITVFAYENFKMNLLVLPEYPIFKIETIKANRKHLDQK